MMGPKGSLQSEGYHIHVYYPLEQKLVAQEVRNAMLAEVPEIMGAGPLRSAPVGPHPTPMFEAWFDHENLDAVVRWIMVNRKGLSVMIHPLSGSDIEDHEQHSMWLGKALPLDLTIFDGHD